MPSSSYGSSKSSGSCGSGSGCCCTPEFLDFEFIEPYSGTSTGELIRGLVAPSHPMSDYQLGEDECTNYYIDSTTVTPSALEGVAWYSPAYFDIVNQVQVNAYWSFDIYELFGSKYYSVLYGVYTSDDPCDPIGRYYETFNHGHDAWHADLTIRV